MHIPSDVVDGISAECYGDPNAKFGPMMVTLNSDEVDWEAFDKEISRFTSEGFKPGDLKRDWRKPRGDKPGVVHVCSWYLNLITNPLNPVRDSPARFMLEDAEGNTVLDTKMMDAFWSWPLDSKFGDIDLLSQSLTGATTHEVSVESRPFAS